MRAKPSEAKIETLKHILAGKATLESVKRRRMPPITFFEEKEGWTGYTGGMQRHYTQAEYEAVCQEHSDAAYEINGMTAKTIIEVLAGSAEEIARQPVMTLQEQPEEVAEPKTDTPHWAMLPIAEEPEVVRETKPAPAAKQKRPTPDWEALREQQQRNKDLNEQFGAWR